MISIKEAGKETVKMNPHSHVKKYGMQGILETKIVL